jgi:hypothetical protein
MSLRRHRARAPLLVLLLGFATSLYAGQPRTLVDLISALVREKAPSPGKLEALTGSKLNCFSDPSIPDVKHCQSGGFDMGAVTIGAMKYDAGPAGSALRLEEISGCFPVKTFDTFGNWLIGPICPHGDCPSHVYTRAWGELRIGIRGEKEECVSSIELTFRRETSP